MPKISRKQIFRHLHVARLCSADVEVRGQFVRNNEAPLTSPNTKRISGPRKFRSSPKKDFCNNIGTFRTSRFVERPLRSDCVEKLENRGAPKISQMSCVGDFSRCKAL